jgi:hypothetical protein
MDIADRALKHQGLFVFALKTWFFLPELRNERFGKPMRRMVGLPAYRIHCSPWLKKTAIHGIRKNRCAL